MEKIFLVIVLAALPVLLAITLHEAAHGYVAKRFGDPTAFNAGRISLNPLRHIDPIGTVLVPGIILLLGVGFLFGWAKPVPVDFGRLRNPKKDMLWVAAAGPAANLVMAFFWAFMLKIAVMAPYNAYSEPLAGMSHIGIMINASLMVLNLLPIPPLDGGRIAVSLLPHALAWRFSRLEPWGFPILLALLYFNVLGVILSPVVLSFKNLLAAIFQLPI